jgi:hypothetical protein
MTAEDTVRDYYEALRRGEPLYPYVAERDNAWKGAISTTYRGYDAIAEALREQTRTTDEWTVESTALQVADGDGFATFADDVELAWTDTTTGTRHGFDTRWSGTLVPVGDDPEWQFVQLHVSAPHTL